MQRFEVLGSKFLVRGGSVRAQSDRMAGVRRPEEFVAWQLATMLKQHVYAFTAIPPASRDFSFCDDIRRAARSGPYCISEGFYRYNPREFHRFLNDARGSLGEIRNQLADAKAERYLSETKYEELLQLTNRAIGATTGLQAYLRTCPKIFEKPPSHDCGAESRTGTSEPRTKNEELRTKNPEPRTKR